MVDKLLDAVIDQIREDFSYGYSEAVYELLSFIPVKNLVHYLPEEDWEQFKDLEHARTPRDLARQKTD